MIYELQEARELVIKAGLELTRLGLIARTWGNVSARISNTQFVITPSGRAYDSLCPDDIVIMNIADCSYEGTIVPSSECGTHAEVYKARPEVGFVIHAHSMFASAMSTCGEVIDNLSSYNDLASDTHTDYEAILGSCIPCARYGMSGTPTLAKNIRACLRKYPDSRSLLMRNHGILCMGDDYDDAFAIAIALEDVCHSRYDYMCYSYIENCNTDITVDYGQSHREGHNIALSVGELTAVWPCGYPSKASWGNMPRTLKDAAALHDAMYRDPHINYVIHSTDMFTTIMSRRSKGFKPYIDDQAQIIGSDIRCMAPRITLHKIRNMRTLFKAIGGHGAMLISSGGAICVGKTYDDATAAAMVLEKGSIAALLAVILGNNKPIKDKYAKKYRVEYLNHYSKLKDYAVTSEDIAVAESILSNSIKH